MSEAAAILRPLEVSFRFPRPIVGSKARVLVYAICIHNLTGIHFPLRVPDRLELAKCLDQFLAKHFVEELTACLAIPMLTAQAAAIFDAQVGGFVHEKTPVADASFTLQVKINAAMHVPL